MTTIQLGDEYVTLPLDTHVSRFDPADVLLAETARIERGQHVLLLGAGNGILGVVAARRVPGGRVVVVDHLTSALNETRVLAGLNQVAVELLSTSALTTLSAHSFDLVLVNVAFQPNSTRLIELLHETKRLVRPGGRVYVAGARDRGADSMIKRLGAIFGGSQIAAYRKGYRVGVAVQADTVQPMLLPSLPRLVAVQVQGTEYILEEDPGVFARGLLDPASAMLAQVAEIGATDLVLDLGSGNGILGMVAARMAKQGHTWLLDANSEAVALAERNLARNGIQNATVQLSDGTTAVAGKQFDVVLSNPPFHTGRHENRSLGSRFIIDAALVTRTGGSCYIVANRFLPYEAVMRAHFGDVQEIAGDTRFKVLHSVQQHAEQRDVR